MRGEEDAGGSLGRPCSAGCDSERVFGMPLSHRECDCGDPPAAGRVREPLAAAAAQEMAPALRACPARDGRKGGMDGCSRSGE